MINFNRNLKIILFSSFFAISMNLYAESFRVKKVQVVNTSTDITNCTEIAKVGINESLGIYLPSDKTFLEGLEIKFEIPETIASYRDTVACILYSSVTPRPTASNIDYSGTKSFVQTLPGRLSWVLQVPFSEINNLKANSYTTITDPINDINSDFIFLRLQPVMKGIPEEVTESIITVQIKPLFINRGKLNLNLNTENNEELKNCSIFIDDEAVKINKNNGILLSTGVHNISVISDFYRNEVRTVRIDQAKNTNIEIKMKSVDPTLLLTAPDGTFVYLDDAPFTHLGEEILIAEGDHFIKLILGDYEVTKKVSIIKGKTYKINLSVDLQISEE